MLPVSLLNSATTLASQNDDSRVTKKRKTIDETVHLDPKQCAAKLTLDSDLLNVVGKDGYRTVRANASVTTGTWYYECKVNLGTGHIRLGYSTKYADLNTPVGYDKHGYSLRDSQGDLFHQAKAHTYATDSEESTSYGPGDVMGCLIELPELDEQVRQQRLAVAAATQNELLKNLGQEANGENGALKPTPLLLPKSKIVYYKNGINLGVAFGPIYEGTYFPAISLYKSANVTFNPGPKFEFPPNDVDFRPFSEAEIVQAPSK